MEAALVGRHGCLAIQDFDRNDKTSSSLRSYEDALHRLYSDYYLSVWLNNRPPTWTLEVVDAHPRNVVGNCHDPAIQRR